MLKDFQSEISINWDSEYGLEVARVEFYVSSTEQILLCILDKNIVWFLF